MARPPASEALLVAHGAPADPWPQAAAMMALAVRVAMWLPGWRVRGVTLAEAGALEHAVGAMTRPLVYPFFMAEGWFTGTALPRRLAAAGGRGLCRLAPFGTDPDLPALMARAAVAGAAASGIDPGSAHLLIAAHGSRVSRTSSATTWAMVERMRALTPFAGVDAGFVEEAPFLADAARATEARGPAVCLPFFALRAGHVATDVPEALAQARFTGRLLDPVGEDAGVPRLIAKGLMRAGT